MSAEAFDDPDELVGAVAVLAGEANQFFRLHDDGAALRAAGDGDASSAAELEQSFVAQEPQGAQDGVGAYLEHGGEIAGANDPPGATGGRDRPVVACRLCRR